MARRERAAGDSIYASAFNLDIKNPHSVDDDLGDPEEWLAKLDAAEGETAVLRNQLKGILEEALLR
jgi:type I restriction enzyme M protein